MPTSQKYSASFSFIYLLGSASLSILLLLKDVKADEGFSWPDTDDRFEVNEACYMKYGFLPRNPHLQSSVLPASPGKDEHNRALEECEQTFFRETFCRNQLRELKKLPYQRICKSMNMNNLKFFGTVFSVIGAGAFVRTMMKLLKISLPYTVCLMVIGMILGAFTSIGGDFCVSWVPFTKVARTPPDVILNVFLPILIFESSFNMKAHLFFRSIFSILILALPGMLLTTFVTAWLCMQFFFSYNWTFMEACLFGSIISATDPVAVVSILKEVGTSETLGILVDGESLLNDGVAILLFEIFKEIIDEKDVQISTEAHSDQGMAILVMFCRITLGGPTFGWFMAKLTISYLSFIFNDAAVEVSVTLCVAYLTYYIGENYLQVSGVMALVLLGITLSAERTCISPEVQGLVHHFWEMLSYLANTVLFMILGVVITETAVTSFKPEDGYYLIFLYFALNIVRLLMIGIMSPLLSRIGYGLSWQNMVVMTWGGLRGAVGTCLALQVFKDKVICHKDNIGPKILLHTAGIVLLTLVVNGTTTKALLNMLKLTEISMGKIQDMANAVRQIRGAQQKALRILRHDRFLADANWATVEDSTNINDPYWERNIKAKETLMLHEATSLVRDIKLEPTAICPNCDTEMETEPGGEEMRELTEEARLRLLKALKVSCWRQYEQGVLSEESVQILDDGFEKLEDKKYEMLHHKDFENYWEVKGITVFFRKKLGNYSKGEFGEDDYPLPQKAWRQKFHCIVMSNTFAIFIYLIILANIGLTCWEASLITDESILLTKNQYIMFYLINLGFTFIYLMELGIKVAGIGMGAYMSSKYNLMDLVILIIGLVEAILSGTYLREELDRAKDSKVVQRSQSSQEGDFLKFVRFIRIIRVLRIFRFFKPLVPVFMGFLNNRINKQLFLGYDLGKGFVTAVDDVQKFLPQIIEQPKILLKFKTALEYQRIEVIREMGMLQKEHPGIAIAVKTRHASRAVLNHIKDTLHEMKEDGLIDEKEFDCLMEEVEQKMKNLWSSPSYMKPASPELALANVSWMSVGSGSKELFEFIYKQSTQLEYSAGDVICRTGDRANGIHLILDGLVRIQYEPTFEVSVEREEYGMIPNCELFQDLSYENEMEDYFSCGTVIGELGALTDQPRAATVTCETGVTTYHIPHSVIKTAIQSFQDPYDSLQSRMWRTIGMKIGTSLLPDEPNFASWTLDRVKSYMERSAVPISNRYKQMVVPAFVSDVIVIYGQYCNANDMNEVFTAPCLIPNHIKHICLKPGAPVTPQVLIIGDEDSDLWENESSDEDSDDETSRTDGKIDETSIQKMLNLGAKGTAITEEDIMGIQLQRQSRTVNFGVVSKSKVNVQNTGSVVLKAGDKAV